MTVAGALALAWVLGRNKGTVYRELGELLTKGLVRKDGATYLAV